MNKLSMTLGLLMGVALQYGLGRMLSAGTTAAEVRETRDLQPVEAPVRAQVSTSRIPRQRSLVS